ncbi:chlorophyllase [Marchantia polymorpha subsp. ruderalis]|uniref:Uncharacterized protein n=2 Tax=Marchantia polymorpha TaxID=3197 RepID=A0A176WUA7_MARPO|nr:hypothetical protein AXG93_4346s1170 [Marchantia polymorpha subsp. ruderalis]PTQ47424.1 hypothetical protein MARPO_0008s0176 [Marchantia polymorpha]BBN19408.1 hypothetical protein Mp_8g10460 [Marchantia polymorpha subsp. ruderalis]|eukprot:PTQ47424.1 hypothetical protein MARPO_0008s0176 [Marchantia polymorpha]
MERRVKRAISSTDLYLAMLSIFALIHSSHAMDDIYSPGPFEVQLLNVPQGSNDGSPTCHQTAPPSSPAGTPVPKPLLIALPLQSGVYPVVQFQHGFAMKVGFYTHLLQHVASYGYIVIAPQMPLQLLSFDATGEIAMAASVLTWIPNNLAALLESEMQTSNLSIQPDLNKIVLSGHSKGGKVAFGLATGVCKTSVQFSAIAGLDPVDGGSPYKQSAPAILPDKKFGLDLPFPTLIVGTGLGNQSNFWHGPTCAPNGVSQSTFFHDSAALAYHFVAPAFGHMDYLDDDLSGIIGLLSGYVCKNGPCRTPMRKFAGGIVAAFLQAVFGNSTAISRAFENIPSAAPVELDTPAMTEFSLAASV